MIDIERKVVEMCSVSPKSTRELLESLGYEKRTGNFRKSVSRLLDMGYIEMTIPDKPQSKKQKYRVTEKGAKILTGKVNNSNDS